MITLVEDSEAQPTASAEMVPYLIWTTLLFWAPRYMAPRNLVPTALATISALAQPTDYMCPISTAKMN